MTLGCQGIDLLLRNEDQDFVTAGFGGLGYGYAWKQVAACPAAGDDDFQFLSSGFHLQGRGEFDAAQDGSCFQCGISSLAINVQHDASGQQQAHEIRASCTNER